MAVKIFFVLFLCIALQVNAFSELIPHENFSINYEANFWVKCNVVTPYSFQESILENSQARERVEKVKQSIELAYLMSKVQEGLGVTNPAIFSFLGFECTTAEADSLRHAIEASHIVSRQVDIELEKLEFEIGTNFTGPGSNELIAATEAHDKRGDVGELIAKIQTDVSEAIWEIQRKNSKKAGETAVWLISESGGVEKIQEFLKQIEKSQEDVKTLEQVTASELQEEIQQAQDTIDELEKQDVDKLGEFELSQITLTERNTIEIDQTYAISPAGLLDESKRNLEKAKAIQRTVSLFNAKGRTANKINAYRKALKKVELAKIASEKSLEKTLEVLKDVEQNCQTESELAKKINKPIGKSMALNLITTLKVGTTYFSKINGLNTLSKNLKNLREIYNGNITSTEKLNLKIEIRELQQIAKTAGSKGVTGASEIADSLSANYALVDSTFDTGEFQQIKDAAQENQQILFELIEDKYGGLRQTFENAKELEVGNLLTVQEETQLEGLTETFAGEGQLAEQISDVDKIQTTLKNIIENALKRKPANFTSNFTYANATLLYALETPQTIKQATASQTIANSTEEVQYLLKELEETSNTGLNAFYTTEKTKKSLEALTFENALKKAQALAKEVQKSPTSQKISDLKKQIDSMNSAIQEAQRKASIEIAIAEQRANGAATPEIEKAQTNWESGKYTQALLDAQTFNKQNSQSQEPGKISGQATAASDEPKLWAIGASLVIILIGAAYLIYKNKTSQQGESE
ncbi:MAG: hypothetical protein V1644_03250 [Candidatus Micrarchaeota archaeon]